MHPMKEGTYEISSGFGERWGTFHLGLDFAAPTGTPFYAAADGIVVEGSERSGVSGFGKWVWIDSQESVGRDFIYGHGDPAVRRGQRVKAGDLIGYVNSHGQSTGPHLHFEVWSAPGRLGGQAEDPAVWLKNDASDFLTPAVFATAMGNTLPLEDYQALFPAFVEALARAGCDTVERVAMFCAQVGHESVGLKYMEEIADGSAYEGRADLGNTQPGDGRRFKGHGPIQITGRHNHTAVSQWAFSKGYVPSPTYFVDNPVQLASDKYGFLGVVWYWTVARNMNSFADAKDIVGATRAVNGGTNGLADRTARWNKCLGLGRKLLPKKDSPVAEPEKRYKSRVKDSSYTDTVEGFILNADASTWRMENEVLPRIEKKLDTILTALKALGWLS